MSTTAAGGRAARVTTRPRGPRPAPWLGGPWGCAALRHGALVIAALGLSGCPEPGPAGPCASDGGDPVLTLANRGGGAELADGVEVEVFPPPQGGVFTELDLTIDDMEARELEYLRLTVEALDDGRALASVRYFGEGLPLRCTEAEVLEVDYLPVGFMDELRLEELDGVEATLTATLETSRGDFTTTHDVVLRVTDY